jgi:UDP-N-acetylglucosamine/UDP-N-acetylgalactosamine diphosphorylase
LETRLSVEANLKT